MAAGDFILQLTAGQQTHTVASEVLNTMHDFTAYCKMH